MNQIILNVATICSYGELDEKAKSNFQLPLMLIRLNFNTHAPFCLMHHFLNDYLLQNTEKEFIDPEKILHRTVKFVVKLECKKRGKVLICWLELIPTAYINILHALD